MRSLLNSLPRRPVGHEKSCSSWGGEPHVGESGEGMSMQPCLLNGHRIYTSILVLLSRVGLQSGFVPPGCPVHLVISRDLTGCPRWGKGCYWHRVVEAGNAALHRTAATRKIYPAPNVPSVQGEKPCSVLHRIPLSTCWVCCC